MTSTAIATILRAPNTVFTFNELAMLLGETNADLLRSKIHYYVKTGALYRIRKGIYAKDSNYNFFECATKIYTPAYISFETVLAQQGVIFQSYNEMFIATYLTREIKCDNQNFHYRKIKRSALTNSAGMIEKDYYYIASKERALLDTIYLNKEYYFDNLNTIDWDECFKIMSIYENKNMEKRVIRYFRENHHA